MIIVAAVMVAAAVNLRWKLVVKDASADVAIVVIVAVAETAVVDAV